MVPELGILIADEAWLERAAQLVRKPQQTQLFLMDSAVAGLERLRGIVDQGADVTVCATDAARLGVEPTPGVRFGSQYDHAVMVRTAARVVAMTGARVEDHVPRRAERSAVVRITRLEKVAQALRSAVGYAGGDLRVAVLLEPPAHSLLQQPTPDAARAFAALRGLDHPIVAVATGEIPPRLRWDLEVSW